MTTEQEAKSTPTKTPEQLVGHWRAQSTYVSHGRADPYIDARCNTFDRCADELELSLKLAPSVRPEAAAPLDLTEEDLRAARDACWSQARECEAAARNSSDQTMYIAAKEWNLTAARLDVAREKLLTRGEAAR